MAYDNKTGIWEGQQREASGKFGRSLVELPHGPVQPTEEQRLAVLAMNPDTSPCTVYRMFDEAGYLLYVGISMRVMERLSAHRAGKSWWTEIARIDMHHYRNRWVARIVERNAIAKENPRYNIAA